MEAVSNCRLTHQVRIQIERSGAGEHPARQPAHGAGSGIEEHLPVKCRRPIRGYFVAVGAHGKSVHDERSSTAFRRRPADENFTVHNYFLTLISTKQNQLPKTEFRTKPLVGYSDAWKGRSGSGIGSVSQNPSRTKTGILARWLCPIVL